MTFSLHYSASINRNIFPYSVLISKINSETWERTLICGSLSVCDFNWHVVCVAGSLHQVHKDSESLVHSLCLFIVVVLYTILYKLCSAFTLLYMISFYIFVWYVSKYRKVLIFIGQFCWLYALMHSLCGVSL